MINNLMNPKTYLEANGLPPYTPPNSNNRTTTYGIIVEVLGWVICFSFIFLLGMFLNWFYYTRHEQVARVFPEEVIAQVEDEKDLESSVDKEAKDTYYFEELELFEVDQVNYYRRLDEVEYVLFRVEEVYW